MEGLDLRYTQESDMPYLKQWLLEKDVLAGFPMADEAEVDDAVKHWIGFCRYKSSLTALKDGEPIGLATLCLMPYKKLAHQCLLSIIVCEKMRNQGVGTLLMNNILHLGKEYFVLDVIYLEVYQNNPAISLYKRFGFETVGEQKYFMKEKGRYVGKIIMERLL